VHIIGWQHSAVLFPWASGESDTFFIQMASGWHWYAEHNTGAQQSFVVLPKRRVSSRKCLGSITHLDAGTHPVNAEQSCGAQHSSVVLPFTAPFRGPYPKGQA